MSIELATQEVAHRIIKLPALGTLLPHLGGEFWGLVRARPGSGEADYALIVPQGRDYEIACAWGGYGKDRPGAACQWDGLANTRLLVNVNEGHRAAEFCAGLSKRWPDLPPLYLPALRELKALFSSGCDHFATDAWYWSSTQYSRSDAFNQHFGLGDTNYYGKDWEGGRARAVRRSSLESLIP